MSHSPERIPLRDEEHGTLNAIVETPRGSRNKFKWDTKLGLFRLAHVLPAGAAFPYDFGFFPSTKGQDGDPLDVLVLIEEPVGIGCLLAVRLIGVIEAEQTESDRTERNDRLIAASIASPLYKDVKSIEELPGALIEQIEHFFVSYNRARDVEFRPTGRNGAKRALELLKRAEI